MYKILFIKQEKKYIQLTIKEVFEADPINSYNKTKC